MRFVTLGAAAALALAGCGGSAQQASTGLPINQANGTLHSYHVTSPGISADLAISANETLPDWSIRFGEGHDSRKCPSFRPIKIFNPFHFPITIRIVSVTLKLPCTVWGLFGATSTQIQPPPSVISPLKLGDAKGRGRSITFTATVASITLAARTAYQIVVVPERSTSDVAFPVVPSATTNLTANATDITSRATFNGLTIFYPNASGAKSYSAACFPAFTNGQLSPPLQTVPLVGTPQFYLSDQHAEQYAANVGSDGNV